MCCQGQKPHTLSFISKYPQQERYPLGLWFSKCVPGTTAAALFKYMPEMQILRIFLNPTQSDLLGFQQAFHVILRHIYSVQRPVLENHCVTEYWEMNQKVVSTRWTESCATTCSGSLFWSLHDADRKTFLDKHEK